MEEKGKSRLWHAEHQLVSPTYLDTPSLYTHTKRCILILKAGGAYAFGKLLGIHVSIESEHAEQMNLCFLSVLLKKKILPKRLHLQCFHCLIHCTDRWFCFCKRTYHYELKISGKQQLNRCQSDGSWIRPLQFVTAKNGHKIPVADSNGETCPERDGEPVKDTDSPFLLHPLLWLLMNLLPLVALMKSLKSLHWFQLHHLLPCLLMSLLPSLLSRTVLDIIQIDEHQRHTVCCGVLCPLPLSL